MADETLRSGEMDMTEATWLTGSGPTRAEQVAPAIGDPQDLPSVYLIGGCNLLCCGIEQLLRERNVVVRQTGDGLATLRADLTATPDAPRPVIVAIIEKRGMARSVQTLRALMSSDDSTVPLVILSPKANPVALDAAVRLGAKGYVDFDAGPEELVRAINAAARGENHLPPELTRLMRDDPSSPSRTPELQTDLSERELDVVRLVCDGLSSKGIAARLNIRPKTVENHRYNIYRKCDVNTIAGLIRYAIRAGIVPV